MKTLFHHFERATVLTPNQRLAATLFKKYNHYQGTQGLEAWPTPKLLPLSAWFGLLWKNYCAAEMASPYYLLSQNQELILWENILRETPENEQLLKLSELAEQASSAWRTLKKWRCDYHDPSFAHTENSRAFQSWAERYEQRCKAAGWLDSESLTDVLIEKVEEGSIRLPPHLLLLNFTEVTPQQQAFFAAAEAQGVKVEFREVRDEEKSGAIKAKTIGLSDENMELQTMARWARHLHSENPEASIGCIASALEEKRELILSIFGDLFAGPESYNISAGKTLTAYPLIQQAFQFLNLPPTQLSHESLSALLTSPFIGDAEQEFKERLKLDSRLRADNITSLRWSPLLEDHLLAHCPKLYTRLQAFLEARQEDTSLQPISTWVHHFSRLLEILGWPGEQSLNSAEYQVVQSFMDLLQETAGLANLLSPISAAEALHYLTVLAAKAYFQPQTPDAPIQILGQLEGAGLPFDYLWVTGLDDTAWPPLPSPNPLLPQDLQKRLSMPNASAERQLAYSRKLTQQFEEAADEVIFSHALHKEQEELRPSPLLRHCQPLLLEDLSLAPLFSSIQQVFNTRAIESFEDEQAPVLVSGGRLRGGASLFEMQAACPFKAFAKLRLLAYSIEQPEPGLPPRQRGSVVHRLLELLWLDLKDQQSLLNLAEAELEAKLHQYITAALREAAPFLEPESLYFALVKQRLEKLILAWLVIEKNRPPFSISALETEKTIEMQGLSFKLRVDRIDRLANGEELILDYKTRKDCRVDDWFGQRLDEPQLPLYCISQAETPVGIAYAKLHASETALIGLAATELGISGLETLSAKTKADAESWAIQLQRWREHLIELFEAFQAGQASVNPKDAQSCLSCDLHSLCRIHEHQAFESSHD